CLAMLQTACVFTPTTSSSSALFQRAASQNTKLNSSASRERTTNLSGTDRKLVGEAKVKGPSKLKELFSHPLYNLPHVALQEDDWLLRLKPEEEKSEKIQESHVDSNGESDSAVKGYDKISWTRDADTHPPWLRFHLGITRWQLYDRKDPSLEQVMQYLATERILGAVQKSGGTQLKLIISFPNYGQALLKPMKQPRDAETDFNLFYFSDFERHNAEIAAFHLDRVLGFNRIPPVVGRLINVTTEIREITTDRKLSRTFFTSPAGNVCFYGQCDYYCSTEHPVCGRPHALEVSLATFLPDLELASRRSWRSPWRRSYSRTKLAQWEKDPDYCDTVKQAPPYDRGTRLVDVIDMAVLDFLMSNMDRHHYETFEKFGNETFLLHLDNGRAFGRHSIDEPTILDAPLHTAAPASLVPPQLPSVGCAAGVSVPGPSKCGGPLLSENHLSALDRRLDTVLKTVRECQNKLVGQVPTYILHNIIFI
uniref:FAM20 C-terminal domain-containing protein n=1 Tax=Neogobius melanostomus TaxID=47308 RepID=A0A8C6T682_9GOBI